MYVRYIYIIEHCG